MKKHKRGIALALVGVCLMCSLASQQVFVYAEGEEETEVTSSTYKLFDTEEKYEDEMKEKMSRVYDTLQGHIQVDRLCPIPGLIQTVYHEEDGVKNSIYYIPQGLCRTEDYILVTAYHNGKIGKEERESNEGWKSVLYVLSANSRDYLTTLVLPQAYHNGGIACDGDRVWFCGDTKDAYLKEGEPFVQYMEYGRLTEIVTEILANDQMKDGAIREEDFSEKITVNNKPSFLECTDGYLWVGTYINNNPEDNAGYAVGYPIQEKMGKTGLDKLRVKRINGMPSSSQGMDIEGDALFVSSSGHGGENWIESSFVSRFDISALMKGENLIDLQGDFQKRIEVPKMNEELIVDKESIYLVFEACGEPFMVGVPGGMKTDRILPLERALWEK